MEEAEKLRANVTRETEDAIGILDEYTRKFVETVQQEKAKLRTQVLQESDNIIGEAEQKAQQILEKATKDAEKESAGILTRSRELAKLIIDEADRFTRVVTELKRNGGQEIEAAEVKVRQEADIIAEIIRKGEKTISDARDKLQNEFEGSVRVVTKIKQELEQATNTADSKTQKEIIHSGAPVKSLAVVTDDGEKMAESSKAGVLEHSSKQYDDRPFVGTLALEVLPRALAQSERFQGHLTKISNLEVSLVDNSAADKTRIVVFLSKPLPIISILNEMSLVKSAVADKECIRVILETSDLWKS